METHICQTCGREWVRKKVRGTRPKYCPECRERRTTIRNCAVCGVRVLKTHSRRRVVCGTKCRAILQYGDIYPTREEWERATRSAPTTVYRSCRECATAFTAVEYPGGSPKLYCSEGCRRTAQHRRQEYRRRLRERAAWVEDINRLEVFLADGYVCHLCGEATDPADYRWVDGRDGRPAFVPGPRYPTLDHVVPIAKGGAHGRTNVRTAHHLCNAVKNDSLTGAA